MKFLVDAQLPARLNQLLTEAGHDAVHTLELLDGNETSDAEVARIADDQDRVVVSRDRDFRDGFLLRGSPRRLLVVATGNISNDDLMELFGVHLESIAKALDEVSFVELGLGWLIVHDDC